MDSKVAGTYVTNGTLLKTWGVPWMVHTWFGLMPLGGSSIDGKKQIKKQPFKCPKYAAC